MTTQSKTPQQYVGVILVRGYVRADGKVKDTLQMLGLTRKMALVILANTPSIAGMIHKVKDYVTWGELDAATAEKFKSKGSTVIGLHPPRGGFERKGIKVPFAAGGALGYRGEAIGRLIERMMVYGSKTQ